MFLIFLLTACSSGAEDVSNSENPNPEAPTIDGESVYSIQENEQDVQILTASDNDTPSNALSFSVSGGDDEALFNITPRLGELRFKQAPNFEDPQDNDADNEYLVEVSVSDGVNQSTTALTITVTNVNETPALPTLVNSNVIENTQTVATIQAEDPENDPLTYLITGGEDELMFSIDRNTGELSFKQAPDYEIPNDVGADRSYEVIFTVSDNEFTVSQTRNVSVSNANDIAPRFTTTTTTPQILEGDLSVVIITVTDDDGDNVSLSIDGGADSGLFSISGGLLTFLTATDYEIPTDLADSNTGQLAGDNVYEVRIAAFDGMFTTLQLIKVSVANINDTAPVFSGGSPAIQTIPENTSPNITISAGDPDGGPVVYSLSGGADRTLFTFDANNAILRFKTPPNFEVPTDNDADSRYEVQITATDSAILGSGADGVLSSILSLVVQVNNANDAPIITSATSINVKESTTDTLYTATAIDEDLDNLSFRISGGDDAARFTIGSANRLYFNVAQRIDTPNDVGADNTYNILLEVTDGPAVHTQAVAFTLVTDTPPVITSVAAITVDENTTVPFHTVTATDVDAPLTGLIYSIETTTNPAISDGGAFSIDANAGALQFAANPDYEIPVDVNGNNVYSLLIGVTDATSTTTQVVEVTVNNLNDNAPTITGGLNSIVSVEEEPNTLVMRIPGTDADKDSLIYSLAGGADAGLFQVVGDELSFITAPNFDLAGAINTYVVNVSVTDGVTPFTQTVTVNVTNVNDVAPVFVSGMAATMLENQPNTGYFPVATDTVENDPVTISIAATGGSEQALFELDGVSGELLFKIANIPDYENPVDSNADGTNTYNVIITANDGVNNTTQAVKVTVTNVDEVAPVFTSGTAISVAENTTATGYTATATDTENTGIPLSYSILEPGAPDQAKFIIHSATGVLSFKAAPDFEVPTDADGLNTYEVEISVSDGVNVAKQLVTTTVTNINDVGAVFSSGTTATMEENLQRTGYFPAAADAVEFDPVTFSIVTGGTGSSEQDFFELDQTNGELLFKAANIPDYENPTDTNADGSNTYNVTITANDGVNDTTQNITVSVSNVNDVAPVFTSGSTVSILENQLDTGYIPMANDAPENDSISYSIELIGAADQNFFNINPGNGSLMFNAAPDYEAPADADKLNTYEVMITANDGVNSATQLVTVTVSDVPLELAVSSNGVKTLSFSWSAFAGATSYKLLSNPDGMNGYSQVGADITGTSKDIEVAVHLTDWGKAQYMLEAYNGTTLVASYPGVGILDAMINSIGYLKAPHTETKEYFGAVVSISSDGSTLAVSATGENSAANGVGGDPIDGCSASVRFNCVRDSGAVFVYSRNEFGVWDNTPVYIKASNNIGPTGTRFGVNLSLSSDGNTLAVGSSFENSASKGVNGSQIYDCYAIPELNCARASGAVYIYTRTLGIWNNTPDYIKSSNTQPFQLFGGEVSLSGDGNTLAVGAISEGSAATGVNGNQIYNCDPLALANCINSSGAVYIYTRTLGIWDKTLTYIKASNPGEADYFGRSVSISSDGLTLAVGASRENSAATGVNGNQTDDCGVTAPVNCADFSGAVYVYSYNGTAWGNTPVYIKASNTEYADYFGTEVSLSGDGNTLAVGAPEEDSSAQAINGDQADGSASNSGAVYVYNRDINGVWGNTPVYIKASNTGVLDRFGFFLSLSDLGSTLAIGSYWEGSAAKGVNGNQSYDCGAGLFNCIATSGAVYVYSRDSSNVWGATPKYVKASNTGGDDRFGSSISLSGDGKILAISTSNEDSAATGINGNQNDESAIESGAVYLY